MKNRKIVALLMSIVCVSCLLVTSSCNDDSAYDTDQMSSSKTTIKVFGPKPALRGAELRFVGTHLDKVTAVVFPVAGEVVEFTKKTETEIRVIIPANAGYGKLILKTPQGEIETASELTYTEPIEVTAITEGPVKAGEDIVISGKYLYLINRVTFQGGTYVDLVEGDISFDPNSPIATQTITVTVPDTAQSGELILSIIYYDDAGEETGVPVEVGSGEYIANIVEPTIASISPTTIKAGGTLTITGADLDLVQSIRFGGNKEVEKFTLAGGSITVTVPEDAQDGPVTLIAISGAENNSPAPLTMLMPTITSISPNPVRNDAVLTVEGTDLDLVDVVNFYADAEGETLVAGEIQEGRTATSLKVKVPTSAKAGPVAFTTKAAKEVASAALALVKPVVTGYASSTVSAGSEMTFQGTDLDLVTKVTFLGNETPADEEDDVSLDDLSVDVTPDNPTSLTITIPALAQAGDVVLTMVNGEIIECPELTIDAPLFAFIPVLPAEDAEIKAGTVLDVELVNADKLTEVQVNGVTTQHILEGSLLHILVPGDAGGATEFKLISSNGDVTYTIQVIGTGPVETVAWTGSVEAAGQPAFALAGLADVVPGDLIRIYYDIDPDATTIWGEVFYADWSANIHAFTPSADPGYTEFALTAEIIDKMTALSTSDWPGPNAILLQGPGYTITKITFLH